MATRVRLNHTEISSLLRRPGGSVHSEVTKHTRRVHNLAKILAPSDTGKLRASIEFEVRLTRGGKKVRGRVWTPLDYGLYQHEGTGPIYPKRAKALVFRPKNARPQRSGSRSSKGGWVFAKKTKGVPSTPYLVNALDMGCPWPLRVRGEG